MSKSKFIVIEGGEGAGKTTIINGLKSCLDGSSFLFTREPGATDLGKELRRLLLGQSTDNPMTPLTEMCIFAADRADHLAKVVKPALESRKSVICDRFASSTFAYQVRARPDGGDQERLFHDLHRPILQIAQPTYYLLLDLPVEVAFKRLEKAGKDLDGIEQRGKEFHERVREGLKEYVVGSGAKFDVLNADLPEKELLLKVVDLINCHLDE